MATHRPPTYRLLLANGNRAFLKAVYPGSNEFQRNAHGAELRIYRELPTLVRPWAPSLLGEFYLDNWRVMLLENLGPKTAPPWTAGNARTVAHGLATCHHTTVGSTLPSWLERFPDHGLLSEQLWKPKINSDSVKNLASIAGDQSRVAAHWLDDNIPALIQSARLEAGPAGNECLLHLDVRSDNLRLTNGNLRLFDWPFASVGPPEFDIAGLAQSVEVEGGPATEAVMRWYAGRIPVDTDVLTGAVVVLSGYFASRSWLPPHSGLPRLRSFQRAQLKVCLRWAAKRLNLNEPTRLAAVSGVYAPP